MSWRYLPVLAAESLAESSTVGGASAPSKLSPTAKTFSSSDNETECLSPSQSGTTLRPSTGDPGVDAWISLLAASRAKTSAQPERAQESPESEADSGPKWRGWFAKYDPDTCSWRTPQCSLLGDWELFSETWPRWGSMLNGVCWERTTQVPHTSGNESGFWRTPQKWNAKQGPKSEALARRALATGCNAITLVDQVRHEFMWPTPVKQMAQRETTDGRNMSKTTGEVYGLSLIQAVRLATPTVQDAKNNGGPSQSERNSLPLNAQVGGALNPPWVEWLMGWPIGWTDLAPLEMGKFQQWCDSHGKP